MTDSPKSPSASEQQQLEEAKQKFEAAKAQFDRNSTKAREAWAAKINQLRLELEETAALQSAASEKRDALEALKDQPAARESHLRMSLAAESYLQLGRMKEREIAVYQECLAALENVGAFETSPPPAVPNFPAVADDLGYLEARARYHSITMTYHWVRNRLGLEVLLRMSGTEAAVKGDEAWEAEVGTRLNALREGMRGDKDLMILVGKLGSELDEARALLEWARAGLRTIGQLPDAARRTALLDPDWAKLNGALQVVMDAADRANEFPVLARCFQLDE